MYACKTRKIRHHSRKKYLDRVKPQQNVRWQARHSRGSKAILAGNRFNQPSNYLLVVHASMFY